MPFLARNPAPPLSQFVEMIWYFECDDLPGHKVEQLMPTGTLEFVINLDDDRFDTPAGPGFQERVKGSGTLAVGVYTKPAYIETPNQRILGVHFKPGGALPFLGLPASELKDLDVALPDLWGSDAAQLRDRLSATRDVETLFDIMQSMLLARFRVAPVVHPAIVFALDEFRLRECSVAAIADRIGLSQRRFSQIFSDTVGLTPKLYCRIQRFQRALAAVHPLADVDWTDVALGCGYFDQSHFNHDFRGFSGFSPGEYLARKSVHLNHVPIA